MIDENGNQVGIVKLMEAIGKAEDVKLDLVEINPQSDPPVWKIMDYGKFAYRQTKKRSEDKKKQRSKRVQIKELKYRPSIEEGDYQIRKRKMLKFIEDGNKVKITVRFRGREFMHKELGLQLLQRLQQDISHYASVEQEPKLEGRQIVMVIGPKKNQT